MRGNIDHIYKSSLDSQYQIDRDFPVWWKRPEGWDPSWNLRISVEFNRDEDVTKRMLSIHSREGEPLMAVNHYLVDSELLFDEEETPPIKSQVFGGNIFIKEEFRNKHFGLPLWTLAEILLMDTDLNHNRLIMDLSETGWTERVQPRFIEELRNFFPDIKVVFERKAHKFYAVIYDFGKAKYNL